MSQHDDVIFYKASSENNERKQEDVGTILRVIKKMVGPSDVDDTYLRSCLKEMKFFSDLLSSLKESQ